MADLEEKALNIFRRVTLEVEANKECSEIYCPKCELNLPSRYPFFGWDNGVGKPSYYCPICDLEF
ncbi:MAG: hypothetical protein V1914_01565 [archaeon]